jgi:RES domain-containing protein
VRLWRISRFAGLDGTGGLLVSGRWHTAPRAVVYCADHPATALLEVFVHLGLDPEDVPDDYRLLAFDASDDVAVTRIQEGDLSADWRTDTATTRRLGDGWFDAGETAILDIPSAVAPQARLRMLSARHRDLPRITIASQERVSFDRRLWKP